MNALLQECSVEAVLAKDARIPKKMSMNANRSLIKYWNEIQRHSCLKRLVFKRSRKERRVALVRRVDV